MAASAYVVLGVAKDATTAEIRAAYRALVKVHHPDVAGNDPDADDRFLAIRAAYEVLADPVRRHDYDLSPDPDAARAQMIAVLRRRRNERRRVRLMRLY